VSGDFAVDLQALTDAASGVNGTIDLVEEQKVEDIDCPKPAFGHDRLGAAMSDFCDRWQHGVNCLVKDGREVADRLTASVNEYTAADQNFADMFLSVLADLAERTGGHTYAE
jgi:hypothetical protein